MAVTTIPYRDLRDYPISKSYQGILRISNILDGSQDEDYYFNSDFYTTDKGDLCKEDLGYSSPHDAMVGGLLRYTYPDDDYKDGKIPISDSAGNFINQYISTDDLTIGSDDLNNGNSLDKKTYTQVLYNKQFTQTKIFPVLNSSRIVIGLENRLLPSEKDKIEGGVLSIDASPYHKEIDAFLIVNNNFDHTPEHITDNTTYKNLHETNPGYTYRTIYRDLTTEISEYDVLVHHQDNIDINNYKNNKAIDSFIDIINLKKYIQDKVGQYLTQNNNTVEVVAGTVIWQYVSLKKWFCVGKDSYSGNYPPMSRKTKKPLPDDNILEDITPFTPTMYQGVVRKGLNNLAALSDEMFNDENTSVETGDGEDEYLTRQLKEAIPLYKRDYTICDGSVYTIYMLLPEMSDNYNYTSYKQFINLFFAIGYQYTDFSNIRKHYANKQDHVVGNVQVYKWSTTPNRTESADCKDKDVLFGVDLLQICAFRTIYEDLKNGRGSNGKSSCLDTATHTKYDRTNAENWLKTQLLPKEFIFNTPIPVAEGGMAYTYTTANEKTPITYNFPIGLEVNSFGSLVRYYDTTAKKYVNVPAWATAEVQDVLDFFAALPADQETLARKYYFFPFQVPNLLQRKENLYDSGTFVGYSPLTWATEYQFTNDLYSVSKHNNLTIPHRHIFGMGPAKFYPDNKDDFKQDATGNWPTPSISVSTGPLTADTMVRSEGVERWKHYWDGQYDGDILSHPDYGLLNGHLELQKAASENINSYTLAELSNLSYEIEFQDGMSTPVIQWVGHTSKSDPDPRWRNAEPNRGCTSLEVIETEPKPDLKRATASANSTEGEVRFFVPEYIQMMPLIKL